MLRNLYLSFFEFCDIIFIDLLDFYIFLIDDLLIISYYMVMQGKNTYTNLNFY